MKYAMVVWEDGGFSIDPRPYIDELPRLQAELPPGAWAFASDPGHYDMGHGNQRCVKNLQLAGVRVATDKSGGLVLEFAPNPWKHDAGLRLSYDACGRVSAETDFNGRTTTYSHNAAGQLVTRTNGAGETVQFERDSLGRVTKQSSGSDIATTFEYGRDGNLGRAVNAHAEIVLERDSVGRTVAESTNGMRVTHAHDVLGQRTRRTTASGWSSHWTYDPAGRPVELRSVAGPSTFEFDAAGREVERRIGDSVTLRQEWAPEGLLITQALSVNADEVGRGRLVQHRAYRHRADGVITEVRELTAGTRRYDLDSTGRVKSVRAHGWGEQYAYDASGALVHAAAPGGAGSEAREFDGTLIRRAGCTRYEHDAQGRLVRKTRKLLNGRRRVWTYSWDAEDRLIEVTTPNAERWQYAYDPLGRRISKQRVSGAAEESTRTEFVWSGVHLVEQIEPDGQITTWDYAPDDPHRPVSQTSHRARAASANDSFLAQLADDTVDEVIPVQQALITDVLGTPTELITACGEIVW
ncbi:hypothetical protein ABZX93_18380 [Streptomyces sp. NPDC006632]|uniref:hypothetical protein n=1 Tax=Streptomyces sp. NPDC006632 TaxID=3157182 RepID=UPI0033B9E4FA